jgi:hypothetical protein
VKALRDALLQGRRRPRGARGGLPLAYRGDGYEFAELRQYAAGDDVRRIDWAASARSGSLQTRVMLEDVGLTLAAIVDTSASMRMGRNRPLLQAAEDAAACWFRAAGAGDRCTRIEEADLTQALRFAGVALRRGTALLVISDFYDLSEDDGALVDLGARCDCTALFARDPWTDGLALRGFVRVRDAESARVRTMYIGAAERRRYTEASRRRERALLERFARAGWRAGTFGEDDGESALLGAFGLR